MVPTWENTEKSQVALVAAGPHQQCPDRVGGVAAMASGRPDRGDPTLSGPVGDRPLRHLEQAGDLTGSEQATLDSGRRPLAAEERLEQGLAPVVRVGWRQVSWQH